MAARDVKRLRDATGAGMMDAKRALEAAGGDMTAAGVWLRERGIVRAAEPSSGALPYGAVGMYLGRVAGVSVAALVELSCESEVVARTLGGMAGGAAWLAAVTGASLTLHQSSLNGHATRVKEPIATGRVVRYTSPERGALGAYLHTQNGRGVNGVLVELSGGTDDLAHDLAVHIAFARPNYTTRSDVPTGEVDAERRVLEAATRAEGKPDTAVDRIVEARLAAWYGRTPGGVLLDQRYVRDDKRTVGDMLGGVAVTRFAQVEVA